MTEKHLQTFYEGRQLLILFSCLLLNTLAFSQDLKISGKVTATANANPLSGVTVREKNKQTATTTNEDGIFTINTSRGATLVFTYVGYVVMK